MVVPSGEWRVPRADKSPTHQSTSSIFAADPSKAYFERFSLVWAPLSLCALLVGVLGTGLWRHCGRDEYLAISIACCLPGLVWPVLFPCSADRGRPYARRFWVKAALWISIFSFYGNYFWTHYFYSLLGAKYLFDSYLLNDVPLVTYFCTYFYFTAYFSFTNVVLRLCHRAVYSWSNAQSRGLRIFASAFIAGAVFFLSVFTAVFEAVSIQHFPLYTYTDRFTFLTIGSVVYGIYFMVGFPMFFALDERTSSLPEFAEFRSSTANSEHEGSPQETLGVSMWYVAQNALAAVALVTLFLDLWRLILGDIYGFQSGTIKLPFVYQRTDPVSSWAPKSVRELISSPSTQALLLLPEHLRLFLLPRPSSRIAAVTEKLRVVLSPSRPSRGLDGVRHLMHGLYRELTWSRRSIRDLMHGLYRELTWSRRSVF